LWLPSYLCGSLKQAVDKEFPIQFYPIGENLIVKDFNWVRDISSKDLVVFIDYFGFNLNLAAIHAVKEKKAWILQDAAQALLSTFDRSLADFVLYSPRKTIGVPDGGILQSQCSEKFSNIKLIDPPAEYFHAIMYAFWSRSQYDRTNNGDWFRLYQKADKLSPIGNYRITELSRTLLRSGFDYSQISIKRRANYRSLHQKIS
jgi:dTDP-4-amino-4,6-dideoxygalactose transaminase